MLSEKKRNEASLQAFLDKLRELAEAESASSREKFPTRSSCAASTTRAPTGRRFSRFSPRGDEAAGGAAEDWATNSASCGPGQGRTSCDQLLADERPRRQNRPAGLGPLIGRVQQQFSDLRFHLIGHSFGGRLVAYTLAGLPGYPPGRSRR